MGDAVVMISGTGRSGTSFIASTFRAAGVDPGGTFNGRWRAGMEYGPLVQMNKTLRKHFVYPECADAERLVHQFGDKMRVSIRGRKVVKDPRFSFTLGAWIHADLVDHVIIGLRKPSEVAASIKHAEMTYEPEDPWARIGYLTWACDHHGIERVVIRFPDVVRKKDEDYWKLVKEITRFGVSQVKAKAAIDEIRRSEWVTQTPPG